MSFFEFPHTRTYDGDLGWLIKHVSSYDETINALNEWITEYTPKIEDLIKMFELFENGNVPDGVKQALYDWAGSVLPELIGKALTAVSFEITDSGYFIASYADSWSSVTFNTTELDIFLASQPQFGHLVLTY